MAKWIDLKGPILADTLYDGTTLVARDVSFTIPEIVMKTTEMSAMGTMNVPMVGLFEDMELEITKIGVDTGWTSLSKLNRHSFEFRVVQTNVKQNGSTAPEGIKIFVNTLPKNIPSISVNPGDKIEGSFKYTVTKLEIVINGKQTLFIDRFNNICKIDGTDYSSKTESLL